MWNGTLEVEYESHYDPIETYYDWESKEKVLEQALADASALNFKEPILIEIWEGEDKLQVSAWFGYRSDSNYEEFIID